VQNPSHRQKIQIKTRRKNFLRSRILQIEAVCQACSKKGNRNKGAIPLWRRLFNDIQLNITKTDRTDIKTLLSNIFFILASRPGSVKREGNRPGRAAA